MTSSCSQFNNHLPLLCHGIVNTFTWKGPPTYHKFNGTTISQVINSVTPFLGGLPESCLSRLNVIDFLFHLQVAGQETSPGLGTYLPLRLLNTAVSW